MYFLRTSGAIHDLMANKIGDKDTLKYLIGLAIFTGFGVPWFIASGPDNLSLPGTHIVLDIVAIVAFFFVVRKCFRINERVDNQRFFNRFFVLNFIALLRILILYFLVGVIIFSVTTLFLIDKLGTGTEEMTTSRIRFMVLEDMIILPALDLLLIILWCIMLLRSFAQLAHKLKNQTQTLDSL
jgi:hypothetical protein